MHLPVVLPRTLSVPQSSGHGTTEDVVWYPSLDDQRRVPVVRVVLKIPICLVVRREECKDDVLTGDIGLVLVDPALARSRDSEFEVSLRPI